MTQPRPPFTLTHEERHSALWKRLKEHWEYRLHVLRVQNDGDKDEVTTAKLRGQIEQIKVFLALDRPLPGMPEDPTESAAPR